MSIQLPSQITLCCWVISNKDAFSIQISQEKTIEELKQAILAKRPNRFRGFDAEDLVLWKKVVESAEVKNFKVSDLDNDDVP